MAMAWLQEIFLYSELELHFVSLPEELKKNTKQQKKNIFSIKLKVRKMKEQNAALKLFN